MTKVTGIHWQGYILRTRTLTRHTNTVHTVRTVPWWFSYCTILKRGIHTSHHNPTPHNPSYVTVHVPWWLRTCSIIPLSTSHNIDNIMSFGVSSPIRLFFETHTTYLPLLLDTCDLLGNQNSNLEQRWMKWSQAGNNL